MWKDWLFFSKSQRTGILCLGIVIVLLFAARMILPCLGHSGTSSAKDNFEAEAQLFLDSLKNAPSSYPHHYQDQQNAYLQSSTYQKQTLPTPTLFRFNPNTADSAQFVRLGIKPRIASNILKYRSKGGKFRQPDDFRKIWGLSVAETDRLLPYIDLPEEPKPVPAPIAVNRTQKTDAILELNSADTAQLQQVRGIGAGFARRIAAYRKRLGGFVKVEQLQEVWGITLETYNTIQSHFTVNPKAVQPICVNKASLETLKRHPYLNFYTAKAIYEQRLAKKTLHSIDDLKHLDALSPEILAKIEPYLSFQ